MAKSYYDYLQEAIKNQEEARQKEMQATENKYTTDKNIVGKEYGDKIKSIDADYDKSISAENINKLIDERKIKEAMGNMGLLDSGLNSKKRRDAKHRATVENLQKENVNVRNNVVKERDNEIQLLDDKKNEQFLKIDSDYMKKAENTAESLYKEDLKAEQHAAEEARKLEEARIKAETERIKAEQKVEAERIKAEAKILSASKKSSSSSSKKTSNSKNENSNSGSTPKKEPKPEYEYDPDVMVPLTTAQLQHVAQVVEDLNLLSRQEYANERRLDKTIPTYEKYVEGRLLSLIRGRKIDSNEYDYLKQYYNID